MTLRAVIGDRKGVLTVMAKPAGEPFLHVGHRIAAVYFRRDKGFVVAFVAAVKRRMELVAERRAGITETDLLGRMTAVAIRLDGKRGLAVMTGTAGIAALHLCH